MLFAKDPNRLVADNVHLGPTSWSHNGTALSNNAEEGCLDDPPGGAETRLETAFSGEPVLIFVPNQEDSVLRSVHFTALTLYDSPRLMDETQQRPRIRNLRIAVSRRNSLAGDPVLRLLQCMKVVNGVFLKGD
jgi:hypothetical protein